MEIHTSSNGAASCEERNGLMKHKILTLVSTLSVLALIGCATGGVSNKFSNKKASKASKVYTKGVVGESIIAYSKSKTCPKSLKDLDKKNWQKLIAIANACVSQQNFAMTEKLAKILANEHHVSPWGPYYLSLVAENKGQVLRSLWMIDLALKKAPGKGILLFQKGRLLWKQNQPTLAMELLEAAADEMPELTDAHMTLAQVFYRDQEFQKAEKHFAKVVEFDERNANAFIGLAECELEDGNESSAVEHLEKAISLKPAALDLRMRQARIYENQLENYQAALEKYKTIVKLSSRKKLDQPVTKKLNETIKRLETKVSQAQPGEQVSQRDPAKQEVKK
jgi:tetratricopeptide (TPR) repeat protein